MVLIIVVVIVVIIIVIIVRVHDVATHCLRKCRNTTDDFGVKDPNKFENAPRSTHPSGRRGREVSLFC